MFGSAILETALGVAFVFLLLSLIASAIREALEVWMRSRAAHLEQGIRGLLDQGGVKGLAEDFYQHPLVASLYDPTKPKDRPSYIPARNFALALLDMAAKGNGAQAKTSVATTIPISLDSIRKGVAAIQNAPVQRAILTAVDSAEGKLAAAQRNLEEWYDSAMDRVSGAYKRQTQKILLFVGFALAAAANVDAVAVVRHLYREDAVREVIVQQATSFVNQSADSAPSIADLQARIDSLPLPLGWPRPRPVGLQWLTMLLGWGVTALAVSLGAPFWFDLLNKFMVIRSTVKPKEKSPEEGSEDRRPAQPRQVAGGQTSGGTS